MAIPFVELPSSLSLGPKVVIEPKPGITVKMPPDTPLLQGRPMFKAKEPAPLYIPQVTMIGTTD